MKASLCLFCLLTGAACFAQFRPEDIRSDFALRQRRLSFDKNLRERTINNSFSQPLDSTTEDYYREACWAIAQFLFRSPEIRNGFQTLFNGYNRIERSTRQALMEAVYAVYPTTFAAEISKRIVEETDPKLFAMQAVYLMRADSAASKTAWLRAQLATRFPSYPLIPLLTELDGYLLNHRAQRTQPLPDVASLFRYNAAQARKTIYSFQRWNRDWPGIAVVQLEDGRFARDSAGRLLTFRQLARSGSDLPYFITNGSTPQGIYSIQGIGISRNHLIGPTPNIQLVMPGEADSVYWHEGFDSSQTALTNYLQLVPDNWRSYAPLMEAYAAGRIGRTEIIAHGTAIDPEYFRDKPFYPLTPTMGCLCAREIWNGASGMLQESDQLKLANTFLATTAAKGYLFVINLDNRQQTVTPEEIERIVKGYEQEKGTH